MLQLTASPRAKRHMARKLCALASATLLSCAVAACVLLLLTRSARAQGDAGQDGGRSKRTGVRKSASADLDLLGLAVTAGPATQSVPKNVQTVVQTSVQTPVGFDASLLIGLLNPLYRVRGELTGPSLNGPVTIEARIGSPLQIPPLTRAGEHQLINLRVVDLGRDGEPVVAPVAPDSCRIVAVERLLVSEVRVRELTYDEIVQAGINITDDSYKAFNFTLGLATTSGAQMLSIPVAFPQVGARDPRPVVGQMEVRAPGVDVPTVLPVMLTAGGDGKGGNNEQEGTPLDGLGSDGGPLRVPGLVVFPGRVGFLNQFFEAVVIVANGAPDGAPLVLTGMRAAIRLPDAGTPGDALDDPLRVAETRDAGRVTELNLRGLGADMKYGTGDDPLRFSPGESGQASFLIEGRREGLHTAEFDLRATLEGLPSGPLEISGTVSGAVLVRDASFAVTFTHPSVVRAGQEYDLGMTLYNSGGRDIQGAFADLAAASINGAALVGQDGRRQFQGTIKVGQSATVKWRLRANVTGRVTASYVKVGGGITSGLNLTTGVGDRNVPLSPDSLLLPDQTRFLPPGVVEASRQLLGQAWSIANAPAGSLPAGVRPVPKQAIVDRAAELGVAGLRVDFGEEVGVSLGTLLRDWLGELNADDGFADALRNTPAGYMWMDAVGTELNKLLTNPTFTPEQLHRQFADAESSRSLFISALVTQTEGEAVAGARFVSPRGERVGFGASAQERAGDAATGASPRLDSINPLDGASIGTRGHLLVVSNPETDAWTLELRAWRTGVVNISLVAPATSRAYKQFVWGGVSVARGESYRVNFRPLGLASTPALEVLREGAWQPSNVAPTTTTLEQPSPRIVGAVQVTPDVLEGGDKYGRLVGVLFSKPMSRASAESAARYRVGGGAIKNSDPEEQLFSVIKTRSARINYGDRFVFLSLDSTTGPYVARDLTISGVVDARRLQLAPAPAVATIAPRVSPEGRPPGAYLTGRVLRADGTPVVNASVIYLANECPDGTGSGLPSPPVPIAVRYTDAQGNYAFDYVRDADCSPVIVSATNPLTLSEKMLATNVAYDGQHMILDLVFLARGGVRGTVTSGGRIVPKAFVKVMPDLDVTGTRVVRTDEAGRYEVKDVAVGNVSVLVVGADEFANASGLAAGTVYEAGQTATVDVALQNIEGAVEGRVVRADGSAAGGALVVAYAKIPGFPVYNDKGMSGVGFAYADRDGRFTIESLPIGAVSLEAVDYVAGLDAAQVVQLSPAMTKASGVLLVLPIGATAPGGGTVTGRVRDDAGTPVAGAIVSAAARAVRTDAQGFYTLKNMPEGDQGIAASDPVTGAVGSTSVKVSLDETTDGADITIFRPATLQGAVMLMEQGDSAPRPLAGAKVTVDGRRIVETDALGRYTLAGVRPNADLTLRFVDTARLLVINTPVRLRPGQTLTKDATLRPGSIRGKVFQPDGAPTLADVGVYVPRPSLMPGPKFGLIEERLPAIPLETGTDGSYSLSGLNPGVYRVAASNAFFPTRVSKGGTLAPNGTEQCDLTLVNTLAGKIQGRVFRPDGTTHAGPGIRVTLGGGSLADATVRTDDEGRYQFAEVFSEGGYHLTAFDPVTGSTNRVRVYTERNKDSLADIRLLGAGGLRVRVVDGAGQPARTGSVEIDGTDFPNEHRFAELRPEDDGVVSFDRLPEGSYAVAAMQQGLGGRAAVAVPERMTIETVVQLQSSGMVRGRVLLPGGATPVGLADVELRFGGRSVGFTTTSDTDDSRGAFNFMNVPSGDFTLMVFDNRTGRVGRSAGRLVAQGETAEVNVELLPVGTVRGRVTANGGPVDHALVSISADGSGIRGAYSVATTDADGGFRFTGIPSGLFRVTVTDAPGGQTGTATGMLAGNAEPLPDVTADIALEPSVTLAGKVFEFGGAAGVGGARVTATIGGRGLSTTTREDGSYTLPFVPLGDVRVRAEAPSGFDRGEAAPVTATQPGSTVNADVTFNGTGTITGEALDNNGARLDAGGVRFVNDAWEQPVLLRAQVGPDGRFRIEGAPAGRFSLQLVARNRAGGGAGELAGAQTLDLAVRLEDAGSLTARVRTEDGSAAIAGAEAALTLLRADGKSLRLLANTDAQGLLVFDYVPLGTASLVINDSQTGGVAVADGLAFAANGQTLDIGELRLDTTPIRVESVTPADGSNGVTNSAPVVTLNFSEPALARTVNANSIRLTRGDANVPAALSLAGDGRSATLVPSTLLSDLTTYRVVVTTELQDLTGHALASEFRSSFVTADTSGPSVVSVSPADGAEGVGLSPEVVVTFDEPLARGQDLSRIVTLARDSATSAAVAGDVTLDDAGRVATYRPTSALLEGTRYVVNVSGQRDATGNARTAVRSSVFTTLDQSPPVIDALPIDGQRQRTFTPVITASYRDNSSGVRIAGVVLTLDGSDVTAGAIVTGSGLSFRPASPLARGRHTVSVTASDNAGNVSQPRTASFEIDDSGPVITAFTVGGLPAANDIYVTSSLRPVFTVSYADDTGVDAASTRLLLYRQGAQPATVPAALTPTGLTYQPPADLEEGTYTVEAVVTNNLGGSTRVGPFNFTLDADAPEVVAVTPSVITQHGGVPVKISGTRLLSNAAVNPQQGTAPTVLFGGVPAQVVSFTTGATDELTVLPPAGAPGPATVEVRTDRGRGLRGDVFTYAPDPRTPLVSEQDTILLWHLDESGDGSQPILDAGPSHSLHGRTSANSATTPGRFGGARARAATTSNADYRAFGFDHTSFTVECWMKSAPVGRAYTLVGKEDGDGFFSFGTEYALRLLPTGGLRALVKDNANRDWLVEMGPNVYDVDDDSWHHLALVLDRAAGRLSIYVDGEERAFGVTPPNFGPNLANNQLLRVGKWALYDGNVSGGPYEFPGAIDEVRVSSTAHTTETIRNTYLGAEGGLGVRITNNSLVTLPRGTTTDVTIGGYNLADVKAAVVGAETQTPALVLNSSATRASVRVTLGTDAPLGDARLVLTSGAGSAALPVRVVELERVALAPEPDTRLLWHLDENGGGGVRVSDASVFSIDGTTGGASSAQPGRFANGRASANVVADTDYGALSFGAGSFTVECWFKTGPVGRAYTLVGKEDGDGFFSFGTEYTLRMLPTGGMRALLRDGANREWRADMFPTVYDVDDGQWHHAALVVDRSIDRLSLYIDGAERASAQRPAAFEGVLSNGHVLRVGKRALYDGDVSGGPYEFPGVIDEVRVSSTAHSAQRVLNDVTGENPLAVTSYNPKEIFRQSPDAQALVNRVVIDGYNLDGATARLVRDGQPLQATINVESSSPRRSTINVSTAAPLGTAQLVLSKAGQQDFSVNVRVAEKTELPGDADTVLLWHLNETGGGRVRVDDEGSLSIDGTASPLSAAQPGHFGDGRASANVVADTDYGALSFGANSFTVECWFKTAPVGRAYTLVGKEDGDGFFSFGTEYALRLLTTGGLRAVLRDSSNREWVAEVGPTVYHVDDGQWHHAALVVDRAADKLAVVIDGEERASAPKPAAFDAVLSNGHLLRVGKWALYDGNAFGGPYEFPGIVDDVRISSTAHAPERIRRDVDAETNVRVNASEPRELFVGRSGSEAYVTRIDVDGFHLDGVTARVVRDGQPLDAPVNVVSSSYRNARLNVALAPGTTPGPAQLVLAREGRSEASVDLRITEQSELPVEKDTVLLWHLNESGQAGPRVIDEGRLSINGTAGPNSSPQEGHFGGGRASANVVADTDYGALSFGAGSFTVECWFKTAPVGRAYTLVGKEDGDGFFSFGTEYALRLLPAGGLRAVVRDSANREWRVDMPGRVYDASQGRWRTLLDNDQWHHAAMVVDRSTDRLLIYVDGVERASVPRPSAFESVLSNGQLLRVGKRALYDGDVSGGPYEFPGIIDDVRISSTAHIPARITSDVFGVVPARVAYAQPAVVQSGASSVPVVLRGYGLAGATVTPSSGEVTVNVVSTTPTQMNLTLTVPRTAGLGDLRFFVRDVSGQFIDAQDAALTVVNQQPFVNADAGAETPLLWHLDEAAGGAVRVVGAGDAVPSVIGGLSGASSTAAPGRFGGARSGANVIADTNSALSFGANSFTVECWFKTAPVGRAYTLVGKEDGDGFFSFGTEYALRLLPAGGLRAVVRDGANREWRADMPGRVYEQRAGRWRITLDDGQWHHVAMVVDRAAGRLTLYADGVERASAPLPDSFGNVLSNNQLLRVGKRALYDGDVSGGPYEFPGAVDEVRLVNFAQTAAQIEFTWLGENPVNAQ
ncbi:MAG TPA: LamG-like jellyroll fold domain-containing protein [Pyrinomonadaceae bacterium]